MVQRQHNHVAEIHRSVPVLAAAAAAVVAAAAREGKEHHMDWPACAVADCYDACSYLDGHNFLQQAEVRREQLAYHRGQHQLVRHYESHRQMPLVHRSAPLAVLRVSGQRSR